jgi:hypothetical protein
VVWVSTVCGFCGLGIKGGCDLGIGSGYGTSVGCLRYFDGVSFGVWVFVWIGGCGMIGRLEAWLFFCSGLDGSYGPIGRGWVLISFDC